jgi:Ca-activated chloride channel family protein
MDIKLHIIAMGDPKSVGEQAMDMETINQVAALSGGQAFEAMNQEQLEMAYQLIHEIEVQVYESQNYWSKRSLHPQILALVVTLYLGVFSLSLVTRYFKQRRQEDLC